MIPLRLAIYAAVAATIVGAGTWWTLHIRAQEAAKWKPKLEAAQAQADVNATATQAVDRLATQTIVIREKSDAAAQAVSRAQGADTPVPPAVLDAWRSGLRDDIDAAAPDPRPR